jgi:hypothetical protein
MSVLRKSNQISLHGGWTIWVNNQAINRASCFLERRPQVAALAVPADDTAALHEPAKSSQTRCHIRGAARCPFNPVDSQHRHRRVWTEPRGVAVDQLVQHEVANNEDSKRTKASQ